MAAEDVTRSVREIQKIAYHVNATGVRNALMSWLYDNHAGVFTPDTTVTLLEDGGAIVSTPFERDAA